MEGFGPYLKRVRDSRGMTINQLAMYSEISAATISRIERGKRGTPKPKTIRKLAAALKVPYKKMMQEAGYAENDEDEFNEDIDDLELTDKEINEKYSVTIDGVPLTPEQIRLMVNVVRADRMN